MPPKTEGLTNTSHGLLQGVGMPLFSPVTVMVKFFRQQPAAVCPSEDHHVELQWTDTLFCTTDTNLLSCFQNVFPTLSKSEQFSHFHLWEQDMSELC